MAELATAAELTDEMRSELDGIEGATPDLERQLRAAQIAADTEGEAETRTAAPDTEMRERIELRSKASLTEFMLARMQGRAVTGAEAELCRPLPASRESRLSCGTCQRPPNSAPRPRRLER